MLKTFKHYAKQTCLAFAILVFAVSCEKEEVQDYDKSTTTVKDAIFTEKRSGNHLNTDKIVSTLSKFSPKQKLGKHTKSLYNQDNGFTIKTETAKYAAFGDYHSYTFEIVRDIESPVLENLLLSLQKDRTYKTYIVSYTLSEAESAALANDENVDLTGKVAFKKVDIDSDILALSNSFGDPINECPAGKCCEIKTETSAGTGWTVQVYAEIPCSGGSGSSGSSGGSGGPNIPTGGLPSWPTTSTSGSGGNTSGGGSSSGSTSNDSPCFDCNGDITIPTLGASGLHLSGTLGFDRHSIQARWLEFADTNVISALNTIIRRNRYAPEDKAMVTKTINILAGAANTNTLTTVEENKIYLNIAGKSIASINNRLFADYAIAFSNLDPNDVLNANDWNTISTKVDESYKAVQSLNGIRNYSEVSQLPEWVQNLISSNILFTKILAHSKEFYQNYAPQNAEEWATLGTIMSKQILYIGSDFIPFVGEIKDAIRGIDALNNGDYIAAAENMAFAIAGVIPIGKILNTGIKVGKKIIKALKIFSKIKPFINELRVLLNNGYEISSNALGGLHLIKNNKFIAHGDEVADITRRIDRWTDANGNWRYPPNNGFSGTPTNTNLAVGVRIDRYGEPTGRFAAPQGTPFSQRSLPPGDHNRPLFAYRVIRPIPVKKGPAAPWFDEVGGGTQYQFNDRIQDLLDDGFLEKL